MRLIDADKIEYYPVDRDGKRVGEMVWKPHIDGIETFDLEAHDNAVIKDFANKIKSHLSEVENSIVEHRNNSKNIANSQAILGMQMCIEDFLGWLSDNTSINPKNLTDEQQISDE